LQETEHVDDGEAGAPQNTERSMPNEVIRGGAPKLRGRARPSLGGCSPVPRVGPPL
jgi:hypothetical protein